MKLARALVRALAFAPALACAACATGSPAPTAPASTSTSSAPHDAPDKIDVDVSALFPAALSRTIGDGRALTPKLLTVVGLERNALTGADGVEPWLSRLLIQWLLEHSAEVRGNDAPPAGITARLRGVRLASLKQDIAISVADVDGAYAVRYWAGKEDISSCAPALKVPLTEVQFEGVLVDSNERVVATIATHGRDACESIAAAFADDLAPSETELNTAARASIDSAFRTLASTH